VQIDTTIESVLLIVVAHGVVPLAWVREADLSPPTDVWCKLHPTEGVGLSQEWYWCRSEEGCCGTSRTESSRHF
jgi:hypothetical protein